MKKIFLLFLVSAIAFLSGCSNNNNPVTTIFDPEANLFDEEYFIDNPSLSLEKEDMAEIELESVGSPHPQGLGLDGMDVIPFTVSSSAQFHFSLEGDSLRYVVMDANNVLLALITPENNSMTLNLNQGNYTLVISALKIYNTGDLEFEEVFVSYDNSVDPDSGPLQMTVTNTTKRRRHNYHNIVFRKNLNRYQYDSSTFRQCFFFNTKITNSTFNNVTFTGTNFTTQLIQNCSFANTKFNLGMFNTTLFENTDFSHSRMHGTVLRKLTFQDNCVFTSAVIDSTDEYKVNFNEVIMNDLKYSPAQFNETEFKGCTMRRALIKPITGVVRNLGELNLIDCVFENSTMQDLLSNYGLTLNFSSTNFTDAKIINSNLKKVNIQDAIFNRTTFSKVNLCNRTGRPGQVSEIVEQDVECPLQQ